MFPSMISARIRWLFAAGTTMLMFAAAMSGNMTRGADALYLEYSVVSNKDQGSKPVESRFAMKACLMNSIISIDSQKSQTVYNFKTCRVRASDPKTATWSDTSLYAMIGFRVKEYQNRMHLADAVNKVVDPQMTLDDDEFMMQTLFGIKPPKNGQPATATTAVKKTTRDGFDIYSYNGKECARVKYSNREIPESLRPVFERFLIYAFTMHPDVRREIVKSGKVPAEMALNWQSIGTVTKNEYTLTDSRLGGAPEKWPGENEMMTDVGDDKMKAAFAAARDEKQFALSKNEQQTGEYIDSRVAAGVPLDALLAAMEYQLQTGDQDAAVRWLSKYKGPFFHDPKCNLYFASMVPAGNNQKRNKEELAMVDIIDRQGLEKACVLDIQRGDLLMYMGRDEEAHAAFLAALKGNPFIAGVWKDLGDLYDKSSETQLAWACWDTARRLYPKHFMLRDVDDLERGLRKNLPEFFLP